VTRVVGGRVGALELGAPEVELELDGSAEDDVGPAVVEEAVVGVWEEGRSIPFDSFEPSFPAQPKASRATAKGRTTGARRIR
jgi:hypothetical protein